MSIAAPARRRPIAAAVIGNVLEWYDFAVYMYLALIIARQFFPAHDEVTSVLSAAGAFGVGYIARPFGALVIGRLADRHGRKPALLLSFFLMAASTLLMGVVPTHASIGLAAPVLLVAARVVQGFSVGGEWGVVTSYMVEWAPSGRRGLFGSLQQIGVKIGLLLGSATAALLFTVLTPEDMSDWGWRVPFLAGALIGPVGFWLRHRLDETPAWAKAEADARPPPSLGERKSSGVGLAGQAFGLVIVWAVSVYLMINYLPVWTRVHLKLDDAGALWANSLVLLAIACAIPLMGRLSDRVGRKPVLLGACLAFVVLPYPLFSYLDSGSVSVAGLIAVQLAFVLAVSAFGGAGPAALAELFPTRLRATWMTGAFTLCVVVFGGVIPYFATSLSAGFELATVYAIYLTVAAVVSAAEILLIRETAFDALT
jgi:MHS family proline/betaine transporter-like MFS transporter